MASEYVRLRELLQELPSGEYDVLKESYRLLASIKFHYPLVGSLDEETAYTKKGHLISNSSTSKDEKCVSIFTSKIKMDTWPNADGRSIEIPGSKLAQLISYDDWLCINPSQGDEIVLSPANLTAMVYVGEIDENLLSGEFKIDFSERQDAEFEEVGIADPLEVQADLIKILVAYNFVQEAYYVHNNMNSDTVALGLFADEMDVEQRFMLMEEIAEISRQRFGLAGAIDVFDDLSVKNSPSWELFNIHSPFYLAKDHQTSADKIEISKEPASDASNKVSDIDSFKDGSSKRAAGSFWTIS